MNTGLHIDYEVADRITLLNLVECYDTLEAEVQEMNEMNSNVELPVHRLEDLVYNVQMMAHLKAVIKHFGGDPGGRF